MMTLWLNIRMFPGLAGLCIALLCALFAGALIGYGLCRQSMRSRCRASSGRTAESVQSPQIIYAVHQEVGKRQDQQDSYGISELHQYASNGVLALVADGMGGLQNGKAISSALVYSFLNYFRMHADEEEPQLLLLEMAAQAKEYILQMLQDSEPGGSTLIAAIVRDGFLHFLTVGDSRIYLYRSGRLIQLNREHTLQETLARKAVNRENSVAATMTDPQRKALTSYFGGKQFLHIDRNKEGIILTQGDRILLLTDGVFDTLSREDLESAQQSSIEDTVRNITQELKQAGNPFQDNSTALILEYLG